MSTLNKEQMVSAMGTLLKAMPRKDREEVMNEMLAKMVDDYPTLSVENKVDMRSKIDGLVIESHQKLAEMSRNVAFLDSQMARIVEFDKVAEVKFEA